MHPLNQIIEPTGVFAHSPFNTPASPPPVPPFPSGNSNTNTAPANVFASMKSGTFAQDENNAVPQSAGKYQNRSFKAHSYGMITDKYNALRPSTFLPFVYLFILMYFPRCRTSADGMGLWWIFRILAFRTTLHCSISHLFPVLVINIVVRRYHSALTFG